MPTAPPVVGVPTTVAEKVLIANAAAHVAFWFFSVSGELPVGVQPAPVQAEKW